MHTDFYNKYEYLQEVELGTVIIRKDAVAYIRLEDRGDSPTLLKNKVLHYLKEGYHTARKHGVILPPT